MASKDDSNADSQATDADDVARERVLDSDTLPSAVSDPETADTSVGPDATTISSCTTIDSPGEYVFGTDIASSADTCIEITADNVVLDGQHHELRYTGDSQDSVGIRITGSNVTVENAVVKDWETCIRHEGDGGPLRSNVLDNTDRGIGIGIVFEGCMDVTFQNNTVVGGTNGMHLDSAWGNTIRNNDVATAGAGTLSMQNSHNNELIENSFNSPSLGAYISSSNANRFESNDASGTEGGFIVVDSVGNELLDNFADGSNVGISLDSTIGTTLDGNVVIDNFSDGVDLSQAAHCEVTNNIVKDNGTSDDDAGISLTDADRNLVSGNVVYNNGDGEQIVLDGDSEGNVLSNNVTDS